MSTTSSDRIIQNKHDVYRGKDCVKNLCKSSKEYAVKILNFKRKKLRLLTKAQQESYKNAKICYICKEKFGNKYLKDKKYRKSRYRSFSL